MRFDFQKLKWDVIAVVAFAVVSLLYCMPQLSGKRLIQHDNLSWQGAAHEAMAYHDSTGKDVLWSNSMFGGMPTYTIYVGAANTNYTSIVQTVLQAVGKPAYFFFIAMVCFYLLMRVLRVNHWLSMIGALAYAFSTYNPIIISVGHETKMLTMGYIPAAIAGLYLIYREKWLPGAALWSLMIALMAMNNHFQVIYYYLFIFVAFGIVMFVMAIQEGKIKQFIIASAIALAGGLLGVAPSMQSILTTQEYAKETMRGGQSELTSKEKKTNGGLDKEYAFRWSNGIGETFCLMIPYLYGGSSGESASKAPETSSATNGQYEKLPLYWGPQPFISGPVYFGAIICFLFVLGALVVKSKHKWWIIAASAFGIILSWGKNFEGLNYFLFDHLPMLNKFRTPSMALVIPQFLFPMLGIWGVQQFLDKSSNKDEMLKKLKIAVGITAGLCVVLGFLKSAFFDFTGPGDAQMPAQIVDALKKDRSSLAFMSCMQSAAFIVAAAVLLGGLLLDKIKPVVMFGGLALLVCIDLLPVAHNYLNDSNYEDAAEYEATFQPRDVDKQILQDKDPYYRVLDLSKDTYNDAIQAYFHKCVGGYSPAKMEMYQDLIDRHMSKGFNGEVLNMLNTKYIIVGGQRGPAQVMPNPNACGNAWFVDEVKWANTADDEINSLEAPQLGDTAIVPNAFHPKKTAVIRAKFQSGFGNYAFGKDSAAYVKLDKYGLDELSFVSANSKDGLAVFSDIYYEKGWKAYVDGKETPIMRADYVLRAIKVPAGQHKIEFKFHPDSYYSTKPLAIGSSVLILILCLGALAMSGKKPASEIEKA